MIPDRSQREQALHPRLSFIVEAPAGSGKTSLLVQRYLRLLSLVERPEAVVAMTFTRKAAAEMRERVVEALQDVNSGQLLEDHERTNAELARAVLDRDRERGWNLETDSSRLQIQTIDSLCAMLTRQMPVVSRFGGTPEVIEHAEELYRLAARHTIRELAESSAEEQRSLFRRVSRHFDNDLARLEKQVATMLARRDQWRAFRNSSHPRNVQDFCDLLCFGEEALRNVFRRAGQV
ncbi:MAG: UvrD-helicase domain-containing protein, partial [Acidobacteriaceae bacterium]|nr:UvrD-helicase domain-containing protein [Acidobacteriaceae bacterium]